MTKTTDNFVTQTELADLREMQVALLLQIDQLEQGVRRLRWWLLTTNILLLVTVYLVTRVVR